MNADVRPAIAADAPGIARLAGELAQSFVFSPAAFDRSFGAVLDAEDACLLVAVRGEELLGYVLGHRQPTFYANGPVASVAEILVRDEHRGLGIGRSLMSAFEGWAMEVHCGLVTSATRRAAAFYRALGYRESATYLQKPLTS